MARQFEPIYGKGGVSIAVRELPYDDAATFVKGDPVKYSSGKLVIATVSETGAVFVGVAMSSVASGPLYDVANASVTTVFTGRKQVVTVALAKSANVFRGSLVNNSDTLVACTQANVGVSYGLRKISAGVWAVDKNITATNDCVTIVGFDEAKPTDVYFVWNAADSAEV